MAAVFCSNVHSCTKGDLARSTPRVQFLPLLRCVSKLRLRTYSNPERGEMVWLNFTDLKENEVQFRMLDMTGRVVIAQQYTVEGLLQTEVNVESLSNGVYVVELLDGATKREQRLIIQH